MILAADVIKIVNIGPLFHSKNPDIQVHVKHGWKAGLKILGFFNFKT